MRLLILTQKENLYLPTAFAKVCEALGPEIVCIIAAPAMSTHGGQLRGLIRHVRLFGLKGTLVLTSRLLVAKTRDRFNDKGTTGHFHSIRSVAQAFDIPYYEIVRVKGLEFQNLIDKYWPELLVSISCPQIIGKNLRKQFSKGCINVHGAPLPRYRGLMPAFWALRFDEKTTAVTVHDLSDKLDNGDILNQREIAISPDETWDSLVKKSKAIGAEALVETIRQIKNGSVTRQENPDEQATYFSFPTIQDRKAFMAAGKRFF